MSNEAEFTSAEILALLQEKHQIQSEILVLNQKTTEIQETLETLVEDEEN